MGVGVRVARSFCARVQVCGFRVMDFGVGVSASIEFACRNRATQAIQEPREPSCLVIRVTGRATAHIHTCIHCLDSRIHVQQQFCK